VNLALRAKSNVLRVYLRKIKVLAKQNKLIIMTPSKTRNVKVLSEEIIQKVRQLLDTTSGVADEKVIAKELGLKAEMVKNAIRHLSLTKT
jgi:ribosomal protein S25